MKGGFDHQVWTRHCAPAAPAFPRPLLPSQFIACLACQLMFHWLIVLLLTLPDLGKRQGLAGSGHYRLVTPVCSELGRGLRSYSKLACPVWGVLAVAGFARPPTFQFGSPEHGVCVLGGVNLSYPPPCISYTKVGN